MKKPAHLLPVAVLVAFPTLLYAPFLFGGKVLYWGVYLLQFYPWRQLAAEQIQAGKWPLWNPYLGTGAPLAANLQTGAFYPPNILYLLMPVERAFGWELALHVALAGLFAYYLSRRLGLSRFGALVSAMAYGGGGYLVARWVFPTMVCAVAWLPLILALTERLTANLQDPLGKGKGVRDWVVGSGLLALVVALQLLAGHPQTCFYSLLIVAAFAVLRLFQRRDTSSRRQAVGRSLLAVGCLLLGVCWGVTLAAIQLLPSAELAAHSQRAGTLTDLQFAYELSFWPWRLISLLAPDFFGHPARSGYWAYGTYWEEAAFLGILPLLLAAFALAAWWRQRASRQRPAAEPWPGMGLIPFFALLSVVSVVLALGNHTPVYPLLFRYVPGFGLFQAPARLMLGYALGMSLLAGIGADTLRLTLRTGTMLKWIGVIGVGIGLAGIVAGLALPGLRPSMGSSTARLGLTLALAAALLLLGRRLRRGHWQALVVGLVAADLLAFGWGLAPGSNPAIYQAPIATAEILKSQPSGRVFVAGPYAQQTYDTYVSLQRFGPADPAYLQPLRESLLPNLNAIHHLAGVGNYDPLTVGLVQNLLDRLEGESGIPPSLDDIRAVLNLLGARYIISGGELPLPQIYDPRLSTTCAEDVGTACPRIYLNDQALPDVLVVPSARVIEDKEARLSALFDPSFDPRAEVLLSRTPGQDLEQKTVIPQPEPWVLRRDPDRVSIVVNMAQAGYLVLTDAYYPGWRATVDGQPAEILDADHAFRAVALGAGEHSVIFEYAPLSFRVGAWATLGAILLLMASLIAAWHSRRSS